MRFLSANGIPLSIFGAGGLIRQVRPEYFDGHNVTARIDGTLTLTQTLTTRYTFRRSSTAAGESGTLWDYNGNTSLVRDNYLARPTSGCRDRIASTSCISRPVTPTPTLT